MQKILNNLILTEENLSPAYDLNFLKSVGLDYESSFTYSIETAGIIEYKKTPFCSIIKPSLNELVFKVSFKEVFLCKILNSNQTENAYFVEIIENNYYEYSESNQKEYIENSPSKFFYYGFNPSFTPNDFVNEFNKIEKFDSLFI